MIVRAKCGRCGKMYEYDDTTYQLTRGRETWCQTCLGSSNVNVKNEKIGISFEVKKKDATKTRK